MPQLVLVYDKVIEWSQAPSEWYPPKRWDSFEETLEDATLKGEAHLMTDSPSIHARWKDRGISSHLQLPAADEEFRSARWSERKTDGPVGYFGSIRSSEIDVNLLVGLSEHTAVEVVGPIDSAALDILTKSNVVIRPTQNLDDLIGSIDSWSAIIFPYLRTGRSDTLVPAKTWNALASGLPMYVTGLDLPVHRPEQISYFDSLDELVELLGRDQKLSSDSRRVMPSWGDAWTSLVERTAHAVA